MDVTSRIAWHVERARTSEQDRKRFSIRMAHLRARLAHGWGRVA